MYDQRTDSPPPRIYTQTDVRLVGRVVIPHSFSSFSRRHSLSCFHPISHRLPTTTSLVVTYRRDLREREGMGSPTGSISLALSIMSSCRRVYECGSQANLQIFRYSKHNSLLGCLAKQTIFVWFCGSLAAYELNRRLCNKCRTKNQCCHA